MCDEPCHHTDCEAWREFFASNCTVCGRGFDEGQRFYRTDDGLFHALCLEADFMDLSEWIGKGRVDIYRRFGDEEVILRDVEVLEAAPGWARLDARSQDTGSRVPTWIDTRDVVRVERRSEEVAR